MNQLNKTLIINIQILLAVIFLTIFGTDVYATKGQCVGTSGATFTILSSDASSCFPDFTEAYNTQNSASCASHSCAVIGTTPGTPYDFTSYNCSNDIPSCGIGGGQFLYYHCNNGALNYPTCNGPNKTAGNNSCRVNNNADPATGNVFFSESDYSSSLDTAFTRHKNTIAASNNVGLGAGWTANYFQNITIDGDIVSLNQSTGRGEPATCTGIGVCTVDTDSKLTVEKTSTGYSLTTENNSIEVYDSAGKLLSITDVSGQTHTMSYNGTLLQTVTDHFNNVTTYTYNTNNMVETMTDPDSNVYTYAYDANNNLSSITYPDDTPGSSSDNPVRQYLYENTSFPHHITGIIDENGNRTASWGYDTQGRVLFSEKANGTERVDLVYNTNGTTSITDSLGANNTFSFSEIVGVPHVTAITGGQCGSGCSNQGQAQTYDANGFIASRTDFEGNVTNYVNNSRGLQTSRTEAVGETEERTITTEWHTTLRLPTKITDNGKETTFTYTTIGQVLTRTEKNLSNNDTRTTTFTYDTSGNVLTIDGPRTDIDDITTFTYDSNGNRASMSVDPDGTGSAPAQVTNFTSYDNSGRLLSMTDPNGVVTVLTYDPRGRLETSTVASGTSDAAITNFEYDGVGNVTKIILANGSFLSYTYDNAQRLTDIEDNLGNKISYTLDNLGNRTQEDVRDSSSVLRRTQSRVFDQLSRMTQSVGGVNQTTIFGYDDNGNQISVLDPLNRNSTSSYDALNRLITSTDPAVNNTSYTYDDRDNLITVTDTRNLTTTYTYDGLDNVTQQVSPDTGTTTYTYDDAGNRLTQTDARNKVTSYVYDALNRLTNISYPNTSLNVSFTYDQGTNGKGRLTAMADASGSATYIYDKRGNLISETKTISSQNYVTSYAYNDADNITTITYPSGRTVDYLYNNAAQVKQVNTTLSSNTNIIAVDITYHPFGPIQSFTLGNGLITTLTYDQDYRLTDTVTDNTIQSLTYSHDLANNILSIVNNNDATRNQSFTYDNLDRLLTGNGIYGALSYTYDAVDNRITETVGSNTDTYAYSSTSNQLQTITGTQLRTFIYDNAGNITSDGSNTYTVSDANRMATVNDTSITTSYTYNGKGERVIKTSGSTTTIYHYDQNGNLIAESDTLGNSQNEYIYLNGQRLALIDPSGTGSSGQLEVIVDNSDVNNTSSLGGWNATVTGTGDYEGTDVASHTYSVQPIVIDDSDAGASSIGSWNMCCNVHYTAVAGTGNNVFTWNPNLSAANEYRVAAKWSVYYNRATDAPYTIHHTGGDTTIDVNQQINGATWNELGIFTLDSASTITLSDDANGQVIADGIQLTPTSDSSTFTWNTPVGTFNVYAKWTQDPSHASDATYTLHHTSGQTAVTANQQSNGTGWNLLGTGTFDTSGKVVLSAGTSGDVVADAIRFVDTSTSTTALYYLHTNHLDTPQVITDGSKTVVWSADYEPFGTTNVTVNTLTNNLRFPGQYADSESGLYYNYFRDYNPSIGRYMQSDPIGLIGGINTYSYVGGDPLSWTDPLGLYGWGNGYGCWGIGCMFVDDEAMSDFKWGLAAAGTSFITGTNVMDTVPFDSGMLQSTASPIDFAVLGIINRTKSMSTCAINSSKGLGDLTKGEIGQIQSVVNEAGRPLDVVGSAARALRSKTSDIDYVAHPLSNAYFKGLQPKLPAIDPKHGIIPGVHNPHIGPAVRFEPGVSPRFIPGK